ncbi:MAG: prepilin-type N-terminal cleavage/methylation domain-containing protein [Elusimicrobia bacterium]|nr:prepilin-type N-terminal cleavage/methylation domain-containing protein [Elusimicrobiota bacterium]
MKVRQGYTLVEVVVAMLLSAVMITAIFTLALSSKRTGLNSDRRQAANVASQSVVKLLANYVTADPTASIDGPNAAANGSGAASWRLDGPNYKDSAGAVWALWPGSHTITGNNSNPGGLFPLLYQAPYNGKVTYWVGWGSCNCTTSSCTPPLAATCQPQINVTVDWTNL